MLLDFKMRTQTWVVGCLAGVLTQGQAVGVMQPLPTMGATGMQYGPPPLGLHPAAPQVIQGKSRLSCSERFI
jgi:hypothetical protein